MRDSFCAVEAEVGHRAVDIDGSQEGMMEVKNQEPSDRPLKLTVQSTAGE